jgi:ribosomal protein S18 acetylase RimI-like enzyme
MRMSADTSVRLAWATDAPAIAAAQLAGWEETYDALPPGATTESVADAWRQALAKPGDARNRVLVALDRARVVGYAITTPSDDPDADPVADGAISELYVVPTERRQGHGSRLLQACAETLSADRFTLLTCWIGTTDDAGRRFLTDAGWAADGATRELATDQGETLRQVRLHTAV